MSDIDVTEQVSFIQDAEGRVSLMRCVCKARFRERVHLVFTHRGDASFACPFCGRRFYGVSTVRILEIRP
jgi:hypothetical protein